ncbi:vesicle-associated membrane protein 4 isoform X2 [Seriola aureovittata]|nr:vesicle-associated membrane protein 4 isoform X2 [Seriola aureovittata]
MPPKFKRHLNDDEVTGSIRSERRNLLEEDSDEEEDFFLRGPTGPRFGPQNDKIKQVQSQVDEVIDVMQENISKVIERGERLDDLQDKSGSLSLNSSGLTSILSEASLCGGERWSTGTWTWRQQTHDGHKDSKEGRGLGAGSFLLTCINIKLTTVSRGQRGRRGTSQQGEEGGRWRECAFSSTVHKFGS